MTIYLKLIILSLRFSSSFILIAFYNSNHLPLLTDKILITIKTGNVKTKIIKYSSWFLFSLTYKKEYIFTYMIFKMNQRAAKCKNFKI